MAVEMDVRSKTTALELTDEEYRAIQEDNQALAVDIIKDELQHIFTMSVPLMVAEVMNEMPETIMFVMYGRSNPEKSTQILAALGLAELVDLLLVNSVVNGLSAALETVCAQAVGGKRYLEVWLTLQAGALMFTASLPVLVTIFFNGGAILRLVGQDPEIAQTAATILRLAAVSLPLTMIQAVQKTLLQAQNVTTPLAISTTISYLASLPLAYALGFWTPLGYIGIYASNIINNAVRVLVLMFFIMRTPVCHESWPGWMLEKAIQLVGKLTSLSIYSMFMSTFHFIGITTISASAGYLPNPAVAIAANSIFIQIVGFITLPMTVIYVVGSIRMGNGLGAGQTRRVALTSRTVIGMCAITGFIGTVLATCAAEPITRVFTSDPEAVNETVKLLDYGVVGIPLMGATFGVQAIFRSCGEQKTGAKLNFVFAAVIGTPLGLLFAITLNGGVTGLWLGNSLGFLGLVVAAGLWLQRVSWDKMVYNARANTHLKVDEDPLAEAA
ncbi:hypothetical protein Poli38472_002612 [Pythium oligandrum]|uniref:Multidrug and toxic compound extrusion protein n=1 Tax=Pythium oligandrum TaxID=41045 RepID=A0A8K1CJ38_PYTOL|nr:hypothetical protein Poli38472_002612 [Pythium oligandrum]|eukprot:TMW63671.1 hypothetical protein Poli38472_002612 [Pythium oligandrum]